MFVNIRICILLNSRGRLVGKSVAMLNKERILQLLSYVLFNNWSILNSKYRFDVRQIILHFNFLLLFLSFL